MRISDWSSDVCSSDLRQCSSSTWGTAMPESRNRQSQTAVLQIRDLHVSYGRSHALQGVELTLERGVHAVVGRNGMGKTTLCNRSEERRVGNESVSTGRYWWSPQQ